MRILSYPNIKYNKQSIEEYKGNPLIESLPIYDEMDVFSQIKNFPKIEENDKYLCENDKINKLYSIMENFTVPLVEHIELSQVVDMYIRQGYSLKNPFDPKYIYLNNEYARISKKSDIDKFQIPSITAKVSPIITIIGNSGTGKSTSVSKILSFYPDVIKHESYNGELFDRIQLVYLYITCYPNMTVKMLLLNILSQFERILRVELVNQYSSKSTEVLKNRVERLLSDYHVGMLVIDEIQHLCSRKSSNDDVIGFLTTVINQFNVPMIFIGSPKAFLLFNNNLRLGRRCSNYTVDFTRLEKESQSWKVFINQLWQYQITEKKVSFSEEFNDILYEDSQGIIDFAKKLFLWAQVEAINNNKSGITIKNIDKIFRRNFKPVMKMLQAIKNNDIEFLKRCDDIYLKTTDEFLQNLNMTEKVKNLNKKVTKDINKELMEMINDGV